MTLESWSSLLKKTILSWIEEWHTADKMEIAEGNFNPTNGKLTTIL
jgi:hypothetical protein